MRVPTGGLNSPGYDRNEAFYAGSDGIISNGGGWYDDTVTNSYGQPTSPYFNVDDIYADEAYHVDGGGRLRNYMWNLDDSCGNIFLYRNYKRYNFDY